MGILLFFITAGVAIAIAKGLQRVWFSLPKEAFYIAIPICMVLSAITIPICYAVDHSTRLDHQQYFNGVVTGVERSAGDDDYYSYARRVTYCKWETEEEDDDGTETTTEHYVCTTTTYYDPIFLSVDSWMIHTTVGDITITNHALPVHWLPGPGFYEEDRFLVDQYIREASMGPGGSAGEPVQALAVQTTLDRGDPMPVTLTGTNSTNYTDYIQGTLSGRKEYIVTSDRLKILTRKDGSQYGVYQSSSGKQIPLPELPTGMDDNWQANKVEFVGLSVPNKKLYEQALMHLNMEAGSIRPASSRFDINVAIVNSTLVPDNEAHAYVEAVNAYFESSVYEKHSLPKNMAVVILGSDGETVTWASGFTLIQANTNGTLWRDLASFVPGTKMNPYALIGWPKAIIKNGQEVGVTPSQGKLEYYLLLGEYRFVRPPMSNNQGQNGYNNLDTGPSTGDLFWFIVFGVIVSLLGTIAWYTLVYQNTKNDPAYRY